MTASASSVFMMAPPKMDLWVARRSSGALRRRRYPRINPADDFGHHCFLAEVVERIVVIAFVQFQCLVTSAGSVIKVLAAARPGRTVCRAVNDQHRQRDLRKLLLQPFIRANH